MRPRVHESQFKTDFLSTASDKEAASGIHNSLIEVTCAAAAAAMKLHQFMQTCIANLL